MHFAPCYVSIQTRMVDAGRVELHRSFVARSTKRQLGGFGRFDSGSGGFKGSLPGVTVQLDVRAHLQAAVPLPRLWTGCFKPHFRDTVP